MTSWTDWRWLMFPVGLLAAVMLLCAGLAYVVWRVLE